MEIILHRANSIDTWFEALSKGWGIEVDLRSHEGKLYIAHDPIEKLAEWMASFYGLCQFAEKFPNTIVLDFKESGWMNKVPPRQNFACTDLIVPDQIAAKIRGVRTLSRKSMYEDINVASWTPPINRNPNNLHNPYDYYSFLNKRPEEYWVDYVFEPSDLNLFEEKSKNSYSYVVSPELHKQLLSDDFIHAVYQGGFAGVCTDYPEKYALYAQKYGEKYS